MIKAKINKNKKFKILMIIENYRLKNKYIIIRIIMMILMNNNKGINQKLVIIIFSLHNYKIIKYILQT